MARYFIGIVLACCAAGSLWAQSVTGVILTDMFGTQEAKLMTSEELKELKANLKEEKSIFPKAVATLKKEWDKAYAAAVKAGDKTYPKFPKRLPFSIREIKTKGPLSSKDATKWLETQTTRLNGVMTAKAAAKKKQEKVQKANATAALSDAKAQKERDKDDMSIAVKEQLGLMMEVKMAEMLKYNRPVPRIFICDPVEGPGKVEKKLIEKQDKLLEEYRARKLVGDATEGMPTPPAATPDAE